MEESIYKIKDPCIEYLDKVKREKIDPLYDFFFKIAKNVYYYKKKEKIKF
jgi:hypothetical protein